MSLGCRFAMPVRPSLIPCLGPMGLSPPPTSPRTLPHLAQRALTPFAVGLTVRGCCHGHLGPEAHDAPSVIPPSLRLPQRILRQGQHLPPHTYTHTHTHTHTHTYPTSRSALSLRAGPPSLHVPPNTRTHTHTHTHTHTPQLQFFSPLCACMCVLAAGSWQTWPRAPPYGDRRQLAGLVRVSPAERHSHHVVVPRQGRPRAAGPPAVLRATRRRT